MISKGRCGKLQRPFSLYRIIRKPARGLSGVGDELEIFQLRFAVDIPLPIARGLRDGDAAGDAVLGDDVHEALAVGARDLHDRAGAEGGLGAVVQRDRQIPDQRQAGIARIGRDDLPCVAQRDQNAVMQHIGADRLIRAELRSNTQNGIYVLFCKVLHILLLSSTNNLYYKLRLFL